MIKFFFTLMVVTKNKSETNRNKSVKQILRKKIWKLKI